MGAPLPDPSLASITRTTNLVNHICKERGYTDTEAQKLVSKLLSGGLNHDQALMHDDLSCVKQLQPDVPDNIIEIVKLMPAGQPSIYSISDVKNKDIQKITADNKLTENNGYNEELRNVSEDWSSQSEGKNSPTIRRGFIECEPATEVPSSDGRIKGRRPHHKD